MLGRLSLSEIYQRVGIKLVSFARYDLCANILSDDVFYHSNVGVRVCTVPGRLDVAVRVRSEPVPVVAERG